jgi:Cu+-exporting ATPase
LAGRNIDISSAEAALERFEAQGQTTMLVAIDGRLAGMLAVTDIVKATSAAAVDELHSLGLDVTLLTGDNPRAAAAIAKQVGIDHVMADVRPEEKAAAVRRLQAEGKVVAVAGDGINDAPALAQADAGIAMGTGTDIAMETAAITLVKGDLQTLAFAIRLSRATTRVIRQNLFWALIYNVVLIPLAVFGKISPIFAAAAMALSSVTVVSNSLRLRDTRRTNLLSAAIFVIAVLLVGCGVTATLI